MKITQYPSKNYSNRNTDRIDMIVMHGTAGGYKGSLAWLKDRESEASTHYLITKTGDIYQMVADEKKAWHAGESRWDGEGDCNQYSLGIELENEEDDNDPYPGEQIAAAIMLCKFKQQEYEISPDRIVGHKEISPGRKTDPVGIDMVEFRKHFEQSEADMVQPKSVVKSGVKSSEFWLTALTSVSTVVAALDGVISPEIAATVVAVVTCAYTILRTWAKK